MSRGPPTPDCGKLTDRSSVIVVRAGTIRCTFPSIEPSAPTSEMTTVAWVASGLNIVTCMRPVVPWEKGTIIVFDAVAGAIVSKPPAAANLEVTDSGTALVTITLPSNELSAKDAAVKRCWVPAATVMIAPTPIPWAVSRNATSGLARTPLRLLKISSDPSLLLKRGITYWKVGVDCGKTGIAVASNATHAITLHNDTKQNLLNIQRRPSFSFISACKNRLKSIGAPNQEFLSALFRRIFKA